MTPVGVPRATRDRRKPRTKTEVFAEKPTRKTAIEAFCVQCMGGEENAGYQSLIRDCTANSESVCPCPLWQFRPYKAVA